MQLYIALIAYCLLKIIKLQVTKGRYYKSKDFLTPAFMNHFPILCENFTANLNNALKGGEK